MTKRFVILSALLLLAAAPGFADQLSADLDGDGEGFASIVTGQGTTTYNIVTSGIGTPNQATLVSFGVVVVNLGASFSNGSASGMAAVAQGTINDINANPGAFTVRVTGGGGMVEGTLELAVAGGESSGPCNPNMTTACLLDGRFRVRIKVQERADEGFVDANVAEPGSDQTALFWFPRGNADNWEILLKMVDACNSSFNTFWVFWGATTDRGLEITITDTERNQSKVYTNPFAIQPTSVTDTAAFATCP